MICASVERRNSVKKLRVNSKRCIDFIDVKEFNIFETREICLER